MSNAFVIIVIMFGLLIGLIILRVPVSYSLCFAVLPILFLTPRVSPFMLLSRMMIQYGVIVLIAIPFFLLAANVMNESGITKRLICFSQSLVGWLPGGLGHINVLVSMIFAGMSGVSTADTAGIGGVLIPAMIKEGYDKNFTVAVTACSSVMGVIIPPSILMIIWGSTLGISISGLFLAGFVPGVMIGISQMILVYFYARKRKYPIMAKFDLKEVLVSFKDSIMALFTPIIVVGGILGGFVTATEASLLAVIYASILGIFIYRSLPLKRVSPLLLKTGEMASLILFAVGAASIYGWVLAYFRIPRFLVNILGSLTVSPTVMLFLLSLVFLFVGTFMDGVPAIIILAPLLKPLSDYVGIDPLHFGIVGVMSLALGLVTPPYGLCLFIASRIADINCMQAIKEVGAFLAVMLIILVIVICFPNIILYIPRLFMPNLFY